MMIEKIPLAVVFRNGVVIGPAADRRFVHDDSFESERSHRAVSHGISQVFGLVLYPGESEVIFAVAFEYIWSFLEAFGQPLNLYRFEASSFMFGFSLATDIPRPDQ